MSRRRRSRNPLDDADAGVGRAGCLTGCLGCFLPAVAGMAVAACVAAWWARRGRRS